jgi:hypothetical protein
MNGFASHGLDEDRFAEKGSIVSAFDAFREFSPPLSYKRHFQPFYPITGLAHLEPRGELAAQGNTLLTVTLYSEIQTGICHENLWRREVDGPDADHLGAAHVL